MSSIDSAISDVLASREAAVKSQIAFQVAAKKLAAQRSQGDAVNQLVEAAASLSKAIGRGLSFDATA